MARKHNVKKERTTGGYKRRLRKRGLGATPTMPDLDRLRDKHERQRRGETVDDGGDR